MQVEALTHQRTNERVIITEGLRRRRRQVAAEDEAKQASNPSFVNPNHRLELGRGLVPLMSGLILRPLITETSGEIMKPKQLGRQPLCVQLKTLREDCYTEVFN